MDLGAAQKCAVFRIDIGGYEIWDAIRGQIKDTCEVLVSKDDKEYASVGTFDFNLRWKDIPANTPWPDDETFTEHNFELIPKEPVEARYVRFALKAARLTTVSEVQVLDSVKYDPFDLRVALPDGKDRSDITQYNPKHEPSKRWRPGDPVTDGN